MEILASREAAKPRNGEAAKRRSREAEFRNSGLFKVRENPGIFEKKIIAFLESPCLETSESGSKRPIRAFLFVFFSTDWVPLVPQRLCV